MDGDNYPKTWTTRERANMAAAYSNLVRLLSFYNIPLTAQRCSHRQSVKILPFMKQLTLNEWLVIFRGTRLKVICYSWKFWRWKFIILNLAVTAAVGEQCTVTLWRHRFCDDARSEILAGNSFIVRGHVTSKNWPMRARAVGKNFQLYNQTCHSMSTLCNKCINTGMWSG